MECLEDNRGFGEALNLPAATSRLSFTMKSPIMSSSMSERSSGPEQDKLLSSPLLLSSSSSASSSSASLITYKKHHMELYTCDIKTPPPPQESSEYCEAHAGLMGVTWSREQTWIFQLHGFFSHLWGILFTCEGWEGRERGGTLVSDKPALGDLARETSCKSKYMAKGENIAKGSKYGKMKIIHPSSWCGVRRLVGGDSASSRTRFFRCWVGRLFFMFSSEHVNVRQGGTKCWSVAATFCVFSRKPKKTTFCRENLRNFCHETYAARKSHRLSADLVKEHVIGASCSSAWLGQPTFRFWWRI